MSTEYETRQKAEGKIKVAISRLADRYPFHTKIIERFKIVERPDVETMAVAASANDVLLFHNPDFVMGLPTDELGGVLMHELHHVLFGHIFTDPKDYPDDWASTVAEEITVNEFIKESIPEGLITLDLFPRLPPMESTEQRYERLKKRKGRIRIDGPSKILKDALEKDGESGKQPGDEPSAGRTRKTANTLDSHDVWQECDGNDDGAKQAVEDIIRDAAVEVGYDEVPDELRGVVRDLTTDFGDTPGNGRDEIAGGRAGKVDWRRLLRRYVGQLFTIRPVFNRPPRRFPDLVGVVPGKRRQSERPKVLAVIDTSGSITQELLEQIGAELGRLARHYDVTVVECDCEIHDVYAYRQIEDVQGRGGTDLRPPFERQFLRRHRPDLIIYFTDGDGPVPTKKPKLPVVWCLVPDGERPAEWGRVIQMET